MDYKIVNIVVSSDLKTEIDLFSLALSLDNVEYEPEQFPGAILKIRDPKASFLIFKNGKIICTGNKEKDQIPQAIRKLIEVIREAQPHLNLPDPDTVTYKVENIVAHAHLNMNVDLYSLAATMDNVEYEPEQFPGAIIKLDSPNTTTLLFKNGKLICAGAKTEEDIEKAIQKVRELVSDFVA